MIIDFDGPKTHVGMYLGNGETLLPTAVMIAYDGAGNIICRGTYDQVPELHTAFLGIHDPAGSIRRVTVDYGATSLSESIDDLFYAPAATLPTATNTLVPNTATNTPLPPTGTATNTPRPPTATNTPCRLRPPAPLSPRGPPCPPRSPRRARHPRPRPSWPSSPISRPRPSSTRPSSRGMSPSTASRSPRASNALTPARGWRVVGTTPCPWW